MAPRRRRGLAALQVLLGATAVTCAAGAVAFCALTAGQQGAYAELAEASAPTVPDVVEQAASQEGESSSWDGLDVEGAVAWISVEGTSIDYPVALQDADDPDYYLKHDLWGDWSFVGCPFLDSRCASEDAAQLVVYGHHITYTDYAFSCLQHAYEQETFDGLGDCWWSTDAEQIRLEPLCAMSVWEDYQTVQRFDAQDPQELRDQLSELLADATAVSADAESLVADAWRMLALVTCSSDYSGQGLRTIVVFVQREP